ncbi:hypothetical protein Tco_0566499 [Tanacetum coccineum]
MSKSTIFFGNISGGEQLKILNVLPFQVGKLPVKYLGVLLITKRPGLQECKQLIDKVKSIVRDWKNKILSYAGRMQLWLLSVWEIDVEKNDSWFWKNLIGLKDMVRHHIAHKVGNVRCTVADMIYNGEWKWPSEWLDRFFILKSIKVHVLNDNNDKVIWKKNNVQFTEFSIKIAWEDLRSNDPDVEWKKIVWCLGDGCMIRWPCTFAGKASFQRSSKFILSGSGDNSNLNLMFPLFA